MNVSISDVIGLIGVVLTAFKVGFIVGQAKK